MTRARTDTGDDRALLTAARAGDERAFACLLERHRCDLETYCYLMLGCPHAAARVVRTTALVAWRRRELAGGGCARIWLYRIATRACLDHLDGRDDFPPA
jgi:RNA polymerase sigma-70 factor (ECF subfamily)